VDQEEEAVLIEDRQHAVYGRYGSCHAWRGVDQCHLTEDIIGPKHSDNPVGRLKLDLSLYYAEHLYAQFTFSEHDTARSDAQCLLGVAKQAGDPMRCGMRWRRRGEIRMQFRRIPLAV